MKFVIEYYFDDGTEGKISLAVPQPIEDIELYGKRIRAFLETASALNKNLEKCGAKITRRLEKSNDIE